MPSTTPPPIPTSVSCIGNPEPFIRASLAPQVQPSQTAPEHSSSPFGLQGRGREWSGFGISLVLHTLVITILALMVSPLREGMNVLTIISQTIDEDETVELRLMPIEKIEFNLPVDVEQQAEPMLLSVTAEDDAGSLGIMNAIAIDSIPGISDVIDNVSFESSNFGPEVLTLGSDGGGDGLDDSGVGAHIAFYGVKATGRRFVFVTDCSGSMNGPPLQRLKRQLREAIAALPPRAEFYIVFFQRRAGSNASYTSG